MSEFAKPAHKRIARAVGYALTLNDEAAWRALSFLLARYLSEEERAALAFCSLESLPDDLAHDAASASIFRILHGEPLA